MCITWVFYENVDDEITIETVKSGKIYDTPFPAVTVCAETKAKKSKIDISDAYHFFHFNESEYQYTDEELAQLEAVSHVCDKHIFSEVKIKEDLPTPGEDLLKILREISIPQNDTFLFCKYRNHLADCNDFFEEVITDDGICYTFNMQHVFSAQEHRYRSEEKQSQWNIDEGYMSNEMNVFPHRALAKTDYGLSIVLKTDLSDQDYLCRGPSSGSKVHIHAPNEYPQMSKSFFRVPLNNDIFVGLTSEIIKNEVHVGKYCHTTNSKPLKFFKVYSQSNCELECLSNFILERCGCVSFLMVRNNETLVCHQQQIKCLTSATDEFFTTLIDSLCDCKPSCGQIKYNAEITDSIYDFKMVFSAYKVSLEEEFPSSAMSRIIIYFKDNHYISRSYSSLEDTTFGTISHIGGILSFFLGASLLSIIEILYFVFKNIC